MLSIKKQKIFFIRFSNMFFDQTYAAPYNGARTIKILITEKSPIVDEAIS